MSFKYFVLQEMIEMKELSGECLKFKAPGRSKMVALFIVELLTLLSFFSTILDGSNASYRVLNNGSQTKL